MLKLHKLQKIDSSVHKGSFIRIGNGKKKGNGEKMAWGTTLSSPLCECYLSLIDTCVPHYFILLEYERGHCGEERDTLRTLLPLP